MISQTTEYALRAMVFLADQVGSSFTSPQIAAATHVPAGYLAKVLGSLAKAKLIHSQRGLHGGFTLALEPKQITILDVVNAVDPVQRIATCPLGLKAHGKKLCPLHKRMDDAMASIETAFANSTLAEVLADPSTSKPLCDAVGGKKR